MSLEANAERTYVRWLEGLDAGAVAEVGGSWAGVTMRR